MFRLHVFLCTTCMPSAHRGWKRRPDPLDWRYKQLWFILWGLGLNLDPLQSSLVTSEPYLQPYIFIHVPTLWLVLTEKVLWLIINVCNGTRITGLLTFIRRCSWSSVYFYIWGDWGVNWLLVVTCLLRVEPGIEWHFSTIGLLFTSHKLSCTMKAVLKWAVLNHT